MKKNTAIFTSVFLMLMMLCATAAAGQLLSPAINVLQKDVTMIKTGVGSSAVSFLPEDFEKATGNEYISSIVITSLPDTDKGVLKIGAVDVTPGQVIPRGYIRTLRFVPKDGSTGASFGFSPGDEYENPFVCTVCMLESVNFAPVSADLSLTAKEGITVMGSLSCNDPEGDEVSYIIISPPAHGTAEITDAAAGTYEYTPDSGFHGKDKFTYAVRDKYSNLSGTATVSIKVGKNTGNIVYADMENDPAHMAAVVMAEKDIITGEKLGETRLFYPEKCVSRAEFLIMAMNAAGLGCNAWEEVCEAEAPFSDDGSMTPYQLKYVRKAQKLGLVYGIDTENGRCFLPDENITVSHAATVIARIITSQSAEGGDTVLTLAVPAGEEIKDDGMSVLVSAGILRDTVRDGSVSRADTAEMLYAMMSYMS